MKRTFPLLATLLALAGCGGGDKTATDADAVRATLSTFATAVEKRDYQRLCDEVFAPELLRGLQGIGLPCEIAMKTSLGEVREPKLTVGAVTVKGRTAQAQIKTSAAGQPPSTDAITLTKVGKRWQVSGLGGAPGASPTPSATPSP